LPANFSGVALAFHRDEALFRGRAMYRIIAAVVLSCLAACAANRSLGSASFVYEIGYESGCARAYVEAKPSPWPQQKSTSLYSSDEIFREGWQKGHTICVANDSAG
jgi:hypothetical protein